MNKTGRTLQNRYLIERIIGTGGMGIVYLAVDQRFGTNVAIKETTSTDSRYHRAFEHEAQLLNNLRHKALPHVTDYFIEGDAHFIVMEYIAGQDLSEIIKNHGVFKIADVLNWADDLLVALTYLHTQKSPVIHRDIKPQNLKLTPRNEIVLLDFGLAKGNPSEISDSTMTTSIFGYSRSYASLEQIQGTGTDPRSDLYSLGATLYHLLTGQPPIDALTRAKAALNDEPDLLSPINLINQKIPIQIADVLHQALALNANLRPQSADQMRTALNKAALDLKIYEQNTDQHQKVSTINVVIDNKPKANIEQNAVPNAKKSFVFAAQLLVALLLLFGAAFALSAIGEIQIQKTNPNDFLPVATTADSKVIAKEEILLPDAATNLLSPAQIDEQSMVVTKSGNLDKKEKQVVTAPPARISRETQKAVVSKQKSGLLAPKLDEQKSGNETFSKNQSEAVLKDLPIEKTSAKDVNRKKTGLRGFLNKIGSGALSIPKSIFKKKKN